MRTGEACGGARVATFDKEPACALVDVADGAARLLLPRSLADDVFDPTTTNGPMRVRWGAIRRGVGDGVAALRLVGKVIAVHEAERAEEGEEDEGKQARRRGAGGKRATARTAIATTTTTKLLVSCGGLLAELTTTTTRPTSAGTTEGGGGGGRRGTPWVEWRTGDELQIECAPASETMPPW